MTKGIDYKVLVVILITVIVYSPGLSGGFLFDDYINLKNITVFSQFDGFDAFIRYILSYNSGLLKRPISTLSFLLNSITWPTNPLFFKLTNILIHIINGVILYLVTKKILEFIGSKPKIAQSIAVLHMAIWLLHPYFVSTTLYVVQRMAMLPVTFILLGFYYYLKGRSIDTNNTRKAQFYYFVSIYFCTVLAVLSKENGIVLPALLLLFEYTIGSRYKTKIGTFNRYFFIIIPTFIVMLSFILSIPRFLEGYEVRSFTIMERLLTESRVLILYLYHFFVPNYFTEGVFTDVIIPSKSLINPISTITSILFLSLLLVSAIRYKNKYPLISFSILFFFLTNIIESTIVPLELYFEHRAYLPLVFMPLPIAQYIVIYINKSKLKLFFILPIFTILPVTTYFRAHLWGDNENLIIKSAIRFPNSVRAVENSAYILSSLGMYDEALILLRNTFKNTKRLSLEFNYFNLKCGIKKASFKDINDLIHVIARGKFVKQDRDALNTTLSILMSDMCFESSINYSLELIKLIKQKPAYNNIKIKQVIDYNNSILFLKFHKIDKSYVIISKYLNEFSAFDNTLEVSKQYIQDKEFNYALKLINQVEEKIKNKRFLHKDYQKEIDMLKVHIKRMTQIEYE